MEANCNVLDLLGVSAVQVFAPVSYALLQASIGYLLEISQFPTDNSTKNVNYYLKQILDTCPSHLSVAIASILSVLFPGFGAAMNSFCEENRTNEFFRIDRPEYAERYFALRVSNEHMTELEVYEILQYKEVQKIDEKMRELNKEHKLTYFLERATYDWDEKATWESAHLFLSIISQMDLVQEDTGFYAKFIHNSALEFFDKIVLGHKDGKKNHDFLKLFVESRDIGLGMICECVRRWTGEDMGFMIRYKDLLAMLSQRIKNESLEKGFSDNKFLNAVVKLWYQLDKIVCREYLNCDAAPRNALNYGSMRAVLQSGLGIGSGKISRWWRLDEGLELEIQDKWIDNAKMIIKSGIIKDRHVLQDIVAFLIIQERRMNVENTLEEEEVSGWLMRELGENKHKN